MIGVSNVIFLDCDGVLNHQFSKDKDYTQAERFGLAQDLVDNLRSIIDAVDNVHVVISSSWRNMKVNDAVDPVLDWRDVLAKMLGRSGVICGDIGKTNEFQGRCGAKGRVKDIQEWLDSHQDMNIENFVVIDDECSELRKAFPNNTVDCEITSMRGLTDKKVKDAIWVLSKFGRNKKMDSKIFMIGDPHFQHKNIIRYCSRPWNSGKDADGQLIVTDADVKAMDEALIANWNSVVSDNDEVYCLGDFALGDRKKIPDIAARLKGHKRIILGNHDWFHIKDKSKYGSVIDFFYKAGFEKVYDKPIIIQDFVILSHEPLQWVRDGSVWLSIYAHVHNQEMYKDYTSNSFCASAERIGYTPIAFEDIIKKCQSVVT